jgi:hypothetical protein
LGKLIVVTEQYEPRLDYFGRPLRELTPEEIRERLADTSLSWTERTAGIFYKKGRKPLTPQEENDAFEIAVVNDVLEKDARMGIEHQGLLF